MNETDLRTAELGHSFTPVELSTYFRAVWGGVSWPAKRPGFAVVVGMGYKPHFNSHDIYLLDECESFDMPNLIRSCMELDKRWEPHLWFADTNNGAGMEFLHEMNENVERSLDLAPTYLLDVDGQGKRMDPLYPYILGTIKQLIAEKRRRLFLKQSKIVDYLNQIEPGEIAEIEVGAFPAIEALSYPLVEMLRDVKLPTMTQTHTGDGAVLRDQGEFDHLLRPGATDPGLEYDPDYDEEEDGDEQLTTC